MWLLRVSGNLLEHLEGILEVVKEIVNNKVVVWPELTPWPWTAEHQNGFWRKPFPLGRSFDGKEILSYGVAATDLTKILSAPSLHLHLIHKQPGGVSFAGAAFGNNAEAFGNYA